MEQIKVEVWGFAFFELLVENTFHIGGVAQVTYRHFIGEQIAVARIGRKNFTGTIFTFSAVIEPGGIKIIHAVLHGNGDLFFYRIIIYFSIEAGQPHHTVSQHRHGKAGILVAAAGNFTRFSFCGGGGGSN